MSNNPLAEMYAMSLAESNEVKMMMRRLLAAIIIGAISDLTSSDELVRNEAADYLLTEGQRDVYALGFHCNLAQIVSDPPDKKSLKISNGRAEFTTFQGERLKPRTKKAVVHG